MNRSLLRGDSPAMATSGTRWVERAFTIAARHFQARLYTEAKELLIAILERQPAHADSLYLLALVAHHSSDQDLAEQLVRQAIAIEARKPPYWVLLGNLLQSKQQWDESGECYGCALRMDGNNVDAYYNWGNTLERQGRFREATEAFEKAVRLAPQHVQARNNLGNQYRQAGRLKEAVEQFEEAGRLDPQSMPVWLNLGNVHMAQGNHPQAMTCFEEAIRMMPAIAVAHNNKGNALRAMNRLAESLEAYRKAIELEPARAEFWVNYGISLQCQGRLKEALEAFNEALRLEPEHAAAHGSALFTLHYDPLLAPEALLEAHKQWAQRHANPLGRGARRFKNPVDPDRPLRIGYVSADFRQHPVAFFLAPVLEAHRPEQCQVFCYSCAGKEDAWTERLRRHADQWRDVGCLSEQELAEAVEADGVDILVDLAGHTAGNRLVAFARKPAPVQVSWLGYFNTTGMEAMDYLVVDSVVCPPESPARFVEQPLLLEGCYLCYRGPEYAPAVTPPPILNRGYVTYGCFNTLTKVSEGVIDLWARILARDKAARLVLKNAVLDDELSRRLYREAFHERGIDPGRIDLLGQAPHRELLAHYASIDVALDPFPYNGGTTTCEALWMGVPVVTLAGDRFVSRVGATVLHHANCGDWITRSPEEYIERALDWGREPERLAGTRPCLRSRIEASVLGDTRGFTRRLEDAFRAIWRRWCSQAG